MGRQTTHLWQAILLLALALCSLASQSYGTVLTTSVRQAATAAAAKDTAAATSPVKKEVLQKHEETMQEMEGIVGKMSTALQKVKQQLEEKEKEWQKIHNDHTLTKKELEARNQQLKKEQDLLKGELKLQNERLAKEKKKLEDAFAKTKIMLEQEKKNLEDAIAKESKQKNSMVQEREELAKSLQDMEEKLNRLSTMKDAMMAGLEEVGGFLESPRITSALQGTAEVVLAYGYDVEQQLKSMLSTGLENVVNKKHSPFLAKVISWTVIIIPIYIAFLMTKKVTGLLTTRQALLIVYVVQLALAVTIMGAFVILRKDPLSILNESSSVAGTHHAPEITVLLISMMIMGPLTIGLIASALFKSTQRNEKIYYAVQLTLYVIWFFIVRSALWIPLARNYPFFGLQFMAYLSSVVLLGALTYLCIKARVDEYDPVTADISSAVNRMEQAIGSQAQETDKRI
eukprot:CAMPEP_0184697052 /NCGR_PEP_ID=MMETSP0313-20130426/4153_1 /TAXON_ID=2792 /ORGANISM="Porphyridium aerugineum, Strain SAG 1380-2" /LENGTH=456 /DNA_ID=CAMNT_0027155813 /DNA_START=102 /DNA_END=1472 /DNA_ORIENTATION=-